MLLHCECLHLLQFSMESTVLESGGFREEGVRTTGACWWWNDNPDCCRKHKQATEATLAGTGAFRSWGVSFLEISKFLLTGAGKLPASMTVATIGVVGPSSTRYLPHARYSYRCSYIHSDPSSHVVIIRGSQG